MEWWISCRITFYGGENFTRIREAIDNASAEDTVLFYNGTYFKNVVI